MIQVDQRHLLRPLGRVANATGLKSELLVMSTLMAWVMRPQPLTIDAVHHFAEAAGISGDVAPRCVSEHVRHGDKLSYYKKSFITMRGKNELLARLSPSRFGVGEYGSPRCMGWTACCS